MLARWHGACSSEPRRLRKHGSPEERARLWPMVTEKYKNYAGYQTKTEREIPLVLLDPAS